MLHRSFLLGLGVIALTIVIGIGGLVWVGPRFFSLTPFSHRPMVSSELVDLDLEPGLPDEERASIEQILPVSSSTKGVLHDAPLAYLLRVKDESIPSSTERAVRVPILMYHHIRSMKPGFTAKDRLFTVTPEDFVLQMEGLVRAGYTTISPRDLEAALHGTAPLPKKPVLLTFDDGYREHATVVLPILQRLHLKATYFIISQGYRIHAYMTNEMVREADASGLVTIADHTRHHVFLARMSPAARVPEIADSKKELEALLGHPVYDFAYPYGSWSQAAADEVRAAGYTLGFGVRLGALHASSTRYRLHRIRVLNGENVASLLNAFSKP